MTNANPLGEWIAEITDTYDGRHERVGWRVASFVAERLEHAEKSAVTASTLWAEYYHWCKTSADQPMVPLMMLEFYNEMDNLAAAIGIGRRQSGGHVLYDGVTVKPMKAAP